MVIDDKTRDENLRQIINREALKISTLSSGKIDNDDYFTCEEIFSLDQREMIEQATYTYFPLGKAFEK